MFQVDWGKSYIILIYMANEGHTFWAFPLQAHERLNIPAGSGAPSPGSDGS